MKTVLITVISTVLMLSLYLVDIHDMHSSTVEFPVTSEMPFAHYDSFGLSFTTTINGDWLAGFWGSDTGGNDVGHVYLINGTVMDPLIPLLDVDLANGIYDNNEYEMLLTINNPTPEAYDYFGWSVTSTPSGDLFVGAHGDNVGGNNAGSAYLFDGTTGDMLFEINNPAPSDDDYFGWSVTSTPSGDLFVGAYGDNVGGNNAGSAYLFDGTTGDMLFEINNPAPAEWDYFGWSVASTINGDLLVGAPSDNVGGNNAGSAYLFDGTTGDMLFEINNPAPAEWDSFGWSVASTINGDLLVGAPSDNVGGNNAGSAYLFDGTTGDMLFEINNPESDLYNYFSYSVASTINGDPIISAVHRNGTINVANSTASYIFMNSYDNDTTTITTESPIILYDPTPKLSKFFVPFVASVHGNNNSTLNDDMS